MIGKQHLVSADTRRSEPSHLAKGLKFKSTGARCPNPRRNGKAMWWCAVLLSLMLLAMGLVQSAAAQTFAGSGVGPIPDGGAGPAAYGSPRDVSFPVSGVTGSLTNISLSISLSHTYIGDLDVVLTSPDGITSFVIFSRVGATSSASGGDSSNLIGTYEFSDSAANNLWTAATSSCGNNCTITPQAYRTSAAGGSGSGAVTNFTSAFASLTSAEINGTWTLRFRDGWGGDAGSVSAASLTLTTPPPPPGPPAITSADATSFAEVELGAFTVVATGTPTPILSMTGTLPAGVTFTPATGLLTGVPAAGTAGVYPLVFTAANGTPPNATQNFTLLVTPATATGGVIHTYENSSVTGIPDNGCPTPVTHEFVVADTFNVGAPATISIGVEITHPRRSDLRLILQAPDGATLVLQNTGSGGASANLNVMYSTNVDEGNPIDDSDADPTSVAGGSVHYRRLVAAADLSTLYSGPANGIWRLRVCDGAAGETGSIIRSRLVLIDATATADTGVCGSQSSYDWGSGTDGDPFVSATVAGITITETSNSGEPPGDSLSSYFVSTGTQGGHLGYYSYRMDTTGDTELSAERTTFEFSTPVVGLNFELGDVDWSGGYEDYTRVEAIGPDGNPVPYQISLVDTADTALAGDWAESDIGVNFDVNNGNVRYRFESPVSSLSTIYAQGNEPNAESVGQFVALTDFNFCGFDYGDGPSSYGTTTASHGLGNRAQLYIGSVPPDGETAAGEPGGGMSAAATGDGVDEASLTFLPYEAAPLSMTCGGYTTAPGDYCQSIEVTNALTTSAQLVGFIDFNIDGDFDDPGERSLPDLGGSGFAGASDGTWDTGNIGPGTEFQRAPQATSVVLVWSGFAAPTTDQTVARFRITTDPSFFNNALPPSPTAAVSNGEIEDHVLAAGTLPVTLSYVDVSRVDAQHLRVEWSTATESGTMGYRILQQRGSGFTALDESLTPSERLSSTRPSDYQVTLRSSSDAPVYLEEVAANGKTERFGPYSVGGSSGARQELLEAPWAQSRAELEAYAAIDSSARRQRASQRGQGHAVEILVTNSGLQRVSVAELSAQGLDVVGQPASALRLSQGDQAVPVRASNDQILSADSYLEFYGFAVTGSLYNKTRPYRLELAAGGAEWRTVPAAPLAGLSMREGRRVVTLDADRYYDPTSPNGDPWYYDEITRTGASATRQWNLTINDPVVDQSARLRLSLWGGSSYPDLANDHRYRIFLNGLPLAEGSFDGIQSHQPEFSVPAGLLQPGSNAIKIELLPTGGQIDRIYVDAISIVHQAHLIAENGELQLALSEAVRVPDGIFGSAFEESPSLRPACGSGCEQIAAAGFSSNDVLALQLTDVGPVELTNLGWTERKGQWTVKLRPLYLGGGDGAAELAGTVVLAERAGAHIPQVRPALALEHPMLGGQADLLIVSSARFAALTDPLVTARRAEGLRVRVVEVAQIYEHYSAGVVDPAAIKSFVADAYRQLSTRYLLLVGGDSYDYFDQLGLGSVSDVPTIYQRTHEFVSFAPVDSAYGDIDGDGNPELAVGRLPARTAAELESMIEKVLQPLPANPYTLVFAAERENQAEGINYAADSDRLIAALGSSWQASAARVYLDQYAQTSMGTAAARGDLLSHINQGANWVSFYGHASPATWSREVLLQGSQLDGLLANAGRAPLVTEFGCWGGYFVEPSYTTMNHAWLLTPGRGARAMIASSSLTESSSDRAIADALVAELAQPGVRLGDALVNAKRAVWTAAPEMRDVILGMSLFGDPTARLVLPD